MICKEPSNSGGLPLTRRTFLKGMAAGAVLFGAGAPNALCAATPGSMTVADLPEGSAPAPLHPAHFPDRLHAFIWRNWSLVPARIMARVVGASTSDILKLGRAMGLGDQPKISRDQQARSQLTVIRRNWHILPYDQLLTLLEWTPEQLDYALREDDFLFIKLGRLKPKCAPLRFAPPDQVTLDREREIAGILKREFSDAVTTAEDPLFGFVAELSRKPESNGAKPADTSSGLRFCYSYFALYGDPLLEPEPDPYPEGYLARLAQAGVNGIWLQAVLHKMAPFPWEPGRSKGYNTRLKNLRRLVARAKRHGIRVFLYLNEPRAMPLRFYETHPELKGVTEAGYAALCTSAPAVQDFLVESVASICRAVPDLGGFFSISSSENLTNCWSHGSGGAKCPRCGSRPPADVIAEVNRLFHKGIEKAGTSARLIAWDWGWNDAWAPDAIRQLSPGTALMSVSEWRLPIERGGVKAVVGEYSISAIGPGPRAEAHWKAAANHGLETIAKIQAGNTWELSTVPYIPAVENVAIHASRLRGSGVKGIMLGWTLGGYPSPNLEAVSEALACGSAEEAMHRVATRRFGSEFAPAVVRAWRQCSAAFNQFPYHGNLLYNAPHQLGPANLLWERPTGYRATMTGFPYDDLDGWRAVYPPEVFIQQFDLMANGFAGALSELKHSSLKAMGGASRVQREALAAEERVMEATSLHFRSTANQARFVLARRALEQAKTRAEALPHLEGLEKVLQEEITLARRLHQLQTADSRFGFEASNQYFYVPMDLAEKVLNCHDLRTRWLPEAREKSGKIAAKTTDA